MDEPPQQRTDAAAIDQASESTSLLTKVSMRLRRRDGSAYDSVSDSAVRFKPL
jgi:hypothetical protein